MDGLIFVKVLATRNLGFKDGDQIHGQPEKLLIIYPLVI